MSVQIIVGRGLWRGLRQHDPGELSEANAYQGWGSHIGGLQAGETLPGEVHILITWQTCTVLVQNFKLIPVPNCCWH